VNWFREGDIWLPIASLATGYREPVVMADETKTIQWFCEKPSRVAVEHSEHKRSEDGVGFAYDGDRPVIERRKVKPAFWAPARIVG
jgi:hypothetical protein